MKFIVDAQLPKRLAFRLNEAGFDAIHTKDLPKKNRTSDDEINQLSLLQERIVITKDSDFLNSFLLQQRPYKLLLVTTGNISNNDLELLFVTNLQQMTTLFATHRFIELSRDSITVHL